MILVISSLSLLYLFTRLGGAAQKFVALLGPGTGEEAPENDDGDGDSEDITCPQSLSWWRVIFRRSPALSLQALQVQPRILRESASTSLVQMPVLLLSQRTV